MTQEFKTTIIKKKTVLKIIETLLKIRKGVNKSVQVNQCTLMNGTWPRW